jgi:FkbM family methyltransferase
MRLDALKTLSRRYPLVKAALYPLLLPRRLLLERAPVSRADLEKRIIDLFAEPPCLSVPEFEGIFRIGMRSHLLTRLFLHGSYEPLLAELCKRLIDPARDVIDVGANVGFYSILAARHTTRKVLAIEPTPNALKLLRENIDRNGVATRVVVFEGAASDVAGELTINTPVGKEEYSSLVSVVHSGAQSETMLQIRVKTNTLDEIIQFHDLDPGFVKIDVEGAEHLVFQGAQAMLEKNRPVIFSEFSPHAMQQNGADPQALLDMLSRCNYRVVDPLLPTAPIRMQVYDALICVPMERFSRPELFEIIAAANAELRTQQHSKR